MFEPFRRLGGSGTSHPDGAGLGLSIVRSVVQTHGGSLTAAARDGGGLVIRVRLTASWPARCQNSAMGSELVVSRKLAGMSGYRLEQSSETRGHR